MNTKELKKHLKYMVPEVRLALIKEPGGKPVPVKCPDDIEKFVEPMKLYDTEHFVCFHLNARNEVSGYIIVSIGTVSAIIPSCGLSRQDVLDRPVPTIADG